MRDPRVRADRAKERRSAVMEKEAAEFDAFQEYMENAPEDELRKLMSNIEDEIDRLEAKISIKEQRLANIKKRLNNED